MATITFLSPRRGSGTTTAAAAATSSLAQSATKVTVIDRTANEDFSRWWPQPTPDPERIDAELTLIDAHEASDDDTYVIAVYDALTEPDPVSWITAMLDARPHLVVIGAIANRSAQCPTTLTIPGSTIRVKPLPHHHLFRDAAMAHRWPLDLSAIGLDHINFPTMALAPHINISLMAAEATPTKTRTAPPTPSNPDPEDAVEVDPVSEQADTIVATPTFDSPDDPAPEAEEASTELRRKRWSIESDLKAALWEYPTDERREIFATAIRTELARTDFTPSTETLPSTRVRADGKWSSDALDLITDRAKAFACAEYQIVNAALRVHLTA